MFNMNKNPTCAQKVIEARHADQVHLLLCDALWQYQVWRDPRCHFHLEQPRGSHMLFQPELEHLRDQLHCAVIDMCTAGQLCHPDSGLPLRKQTEIWTTSAVLFGQLSQYRCTRDQGRGRLNALAKSNARAVATRGPRRRPKTMNALLWRFKGRAAGQKQRARCCGNSREALPLTTSEACCGKLAL